MEYSKAAARKVERVALCAISMLQTLIKYGQCVLYCLLDFSDCTICWKCTSALYIKWIARTLKTNVRIHRVEAD